MFGIKPSPSKTERQQIIERAIAAVLANPDPKYALDALDKFAIEFGALKEDAVLAARYELLKRALLADTKSGDKTILANFLQWVQDKGFLPQQVQTAMEETGLSRTLQANQTAGALPQSSRPVMPAQQPRSQPIVTPPPKARRPTPPKPKGQDSFIPKPQKLEQDCPEADEMGEGIVNVCETQSFKVEYLGCNPNSPRIYSLKFKPWLAKGVSVKKFRTLVDDFVVHAGLPDNRKPIIQMRSGFVEIQVPRKDWKPCLLLNYVQPPNPGDPPYDPWLFPTGVNTDGNLAKLRIVHSLTGGKTGSGKTGQQKAMISSKMLLHTPDEARFLLIDLMGSFSKFEGATWLWEPYGIISNEDEHRAAEEALEALRSVVEEVKKRQKLFRRLKVESIEEYNARYPAEPLYYLYVFIDEVAMLKDVLKLIDKAIDAEFVDELNDMLNLLAEQSRKQGISVHVATQRPSADLLPPRFKANTSRLSLQAETKADSSIILGIESDLAVHLMGEGDMFAKQPGGELLRLQGLFVPDSLIEAIIAEGDRLYGDRPLRKTPSFGAVTVKEPQLTEDDRDWQRYQKLVELESRTPKASDWEIAIALFGDEYDPPEKAGNGNTLKANNKRVAKLREKFGGSDG